MRITRKPVRACHGCLLNQGDHCWGYEFPHQQWCGRRRCPAYDNPDVYALFRDWLEQPNVKTPRDLRRDAYPRRKLRRVYHLEKTGKSG